MNDEKIKIIDNFIQACESLTEILQGERLALVDVPDFDKPESKPKAKAKAKQKAKTKPAITLAQLQEKCSALVTGGLTSDDIREVIKRFSKQGLRGVAVLDYPSLLGELEQKEVKS